MCCVYIFQFQKLDMEKIDFLLQEDLSLMEQSSVFPSLCQEITFIDNEKIKAFV